MDSLQTRNILVSIAASWAGKRNSGNVRESELLELQSLIKQNLVTIEDDSKSDTYWISLTPAGQEKLYELNKTYSGS